MTNKNRYIAHKETIEKYGETAMINKSIQEFNELIEELRDYKAGYKNKTDIIEEIADCDNMLDKLIILFGFSSKEVVEIKNNKMIRTIARL
jgi:predicted house-cleaning noncanonical NTP pyrophosphatase (MazG superfamily)